MPRQLIVQCDNCGIHRDEFWKARADAIHKTVGSNGEVKQAAQRACTWWLLEEHSMILRTGPLDFCSLKCLNAFTQDPEIVALYPADFAERAYGV